MCDGNKKWTVVQGETWLTMGSDSRLMSNAEKKYWEKKSDHMLEEAIKYIVWSITRW